MLFCIWLYRASISAHSNSETRPAHGPSQHKSTCSPFKKQRDDFLMALEDGVVQGQRLCARGLGVDIGIELEKLPRALQAPVPTVHMQRCLA